VIPVKLDGQLGLDVGAGFARVLSHIDGIPGRADHSIVLITEGSPTKWTYAKAKADYFAVNFWELPVQKLLQRGVPVVCAAGNVDPSEPDRKIVDTLPQVLQHDEETPIINVGNAAFDGKRRASSRYFDKGDDRLMIYAPGTEVKTLSKDGFKAVPATGTSYCK
jgi:hypothetical protein